jgi:predicted kinase
MSLYRWERREVENTLIIFAGMPGSGKTTLARMVAETLRIPVLAKDRVQRVLRDRDLTDSTSGEGYYVILDLADEQLSMGVSVILDATFPLDHFRVVASDIAARHNARFCAVYCHCSDEAVWRARMEDRVQYIPGWTPVGWEDVERMRDYYQPWRNNALAIDSLLSPEINFPPVLSYIQNAARRTYIPNEAVSEREDRQQ